MNIPTPAPLTIFHIQSWCDDRGRVIIGKKPMGADGMPDWAAQWSFIGQGVCGVNTPKGVQQVPFEIPLPGPSIAEAFEQFDAAQQPAWDVHLEKLRMLALRAGATLNELPSTANGKKR